MSKVKRLKRQFSRRAFAPHTTPFAGCGGRKSATSRPAARAGGAPLAGPARPRPDRAHLPVGPESIRSLAEDVTALNIY